MKRLKNFTILNKVLLFVFHVNETAIQSVLKIIYDKYWSVVELNFTTVLCFLDELVGVVGVDLSLDELLADAIYFRAAGDIAFTFLLDSTGRVVTHPFMPKPSSVMSSPIITNFAAFERDEAVQKFLKETLHFISTNRGFSGNSLQVSDVFENVFETTRLHPTVSNLTYGMILQFFHNHHRLILDYVLSLSMDLARFRMVIFFTMACRFV